MSALPDPLLGSVVECDSIDRESWAALRARSRALQSIEAHGCRLYPHFAALCQDLYSALYKYNVVLRPEADCPRSAALGRQVLEAVVESPGYAALRETTLLDPARAACGVTVLGRLALALLRDEEVVSVEELAQTAALAHEEAVLDSERKALVETEEVAAALGEEAQRKLDQLAQSIDERRHEIDERGQDLPDALPESARGRIREAVRALPERMDRAEEEAATWGRGVGATAKVGASERLELGDRIAESESLRRLAMLAGSFREYARRERRRRVARRPHETHDVTLGDDWARILPAELVSLRHPLLGRALRHRALEGRMQVYRLDGPDDRGRGPLVVCLDGSGSMQGDRDLWAKATSLALCDIARRQRRACRVISFSDGERAIRTFDLVPRARRTGRQADLREIVRMAEHFPGGGTNFVLPLRKALEALAESSYRLGDIVFVTDGEADVPEDVLQEVRAARSRLGFRVWGVWVDVGRSPREDALAVLGRFCDEVTTVSRLTADSVRDLFVKI